MKCQHKMILKAMTFAIVVLSVAFLVFPFMMLLVNGYTDWVYSLFNK